jgi:hypothetical protein
MVGDIVISARLILIDKKKLEPIDFPCMCVPFYGGFEGAGGKVYRWEHAGLVDAVVRGAADYFRIENISPIKQ